MYLRDLVTLILSCSNFTTDFLVAKHFPRLTSLKLDTKEKIRADRFTDANLAAICRQCPLLTDLNLSCCFGITNDGLGALQCPFLTKLNVGCNSGITSDGLAGLQCPLLTDLDLTGCRHITKDGLAGLSSLLSAWGAAFSSRAKSYRVFNALSLKPSYCGAVTSPTLG